MRKLLSALLFFSQILFSYAFGENCSALFTQYGMNEITPVNLKNGTVGNPIAVGEGPQGIAITADGKTAYVACYGSAEIFPINLSTRKPGEPISVKRHPYSIAIAYNKMAYVTHHGSHEISSIDLETGVVKTAFTLKEKPLALAIDGQMAYVTCHDLKGIIPIQLETKTIHPPLMVKHQPHHIAIAPDGKNAYVTHPQSNTITPIDLETGVAASPITVGSLPHDIAISPEGKRVYVTHLASKEVTCIDLSSGSAASIRLGKTILGISNIPERNFVFTRSKTKAAAYTLTILRKTPFSIFSQEVTFSAVVSPDPGDGQEVEFFNGSISLGTARTQEGVAQLTTSQLPVGNLSIVAAYQGDTSPAYFQVVDQAGTRTSLTSSVDPTVAWQPVTFTTTVAAESPALGVPTGIVSFVINGIPTGRGTLNESGIAEFTTGLTAGTNYILAVYIGDGNFLGSGSGSILQVANLAETTVFLTSSPNPSVVGEPVTFTATVSPEPPAEGYPNGPVSFFTDYPCVGFMTHTNVRGVATYTKTYTTEGSYKVFVHYDGNRDFDFSESKRYFIQEVKSDK